MATADDIRLTIERDGDNTILTATVRVGHRIVIDPPGLPPGRYYERLGTGVPDGHHYLFGPLEKCAAMQTDKGPIIMHSSNVHWWDIAEES